MIKKFLISFSVFSILLFSFVPCSYAFSTSTYADIVQSSTQSNNLISLAENYDSFSNSDFVVAQIGQYEYRIFWGNLNYNGSSITGSEVEYLQYVREGSGYDYQYHYRYGTDSTLSLTVNHIVVSNIDSVGMRSAIYVQYNDYDFKLVFFIFMTAIMLASLFLIFRSVYK